MLTVALWLSHYFNDLFSLQTPKIPVEPRASFVQTAKEELDDSAVLNYLIGLLIRRAHWLLVGLSSVLTRENWLSLPNIGERAQTATPSNSTEEKTRHLFTVLMEHLSFDTFYFEKTKCCQLENKFRVCVLSLICVCWSFFTRLNSLIVTGLTPACSSYPCLHLRLPSPVCLCPCVICRHPRSGRGVVLVLRTVLHESRLNLIGWTSRDAVPASVQLLLWHFIVCFVLRFFFPSSSRVSLYPHVCFVCEY